MMGLFKRNDSATTVAAAGQRREKDSKKSGAATPQERQAQVSEPVHKKVVKEGRYMPGDSRNNDGSERKRGWKPSKD
jgi:hypothetical protein